MQLDRTHALHGVPWAGGVRVQFHGERVGTRLGVLLRAWGGESLAISMSWDGIGMWKAIGLGRIVVVVATVWLGTIGVVRADEPGGVDSYGGVTATVVAVERGW